MSLIYIKDEDKEDMKSWGDKIVHVKIRQFFDDELSLEFLEGPECLLYQYVELSFYKKEIKP